MKGFSFLADMLDYMLENNITYEMPFKEILFIVANKNNTSVSIVRKDLDTLIKRSPIDESLNIKERTITKIVYLLLYKLK